MLVMHGGIMSFFGRVVSCRSKSRVSRRLVVATVVGALVAGPALSAAASPAGHRSNQLARSVSRSTTADTDDLNVSGVYSDTSSSKAPMSRV